MDSEEIYTLMMDALDGELTEVGRAELEVHLRARPDLAQEWARVQAVDVLLRSAPMVAPPAGFSQRTLARIGDQRQRLWAGIVAYVTVLAAGFVPLAVILYLGAQFVPALNEPAFVRGVWQGAGALVRVGQATASAFLGGVNELVSTQPSVLIYPLLMAAVAVLWIAVYGRLVLSPSRVQR